LDARRAPVVDAFTGAVVLGTVEHHLRRAGKRYSATVAAPESGDVIGRFAPLMWLAPERCALDLPVGQTAPVRDPRILLPATRVDSNEQANALARFLGASSQRSQLGDARLSPKEAATLAEALPVLAENALRHADGSTCGAVICAALESDNREAQLVVLDLGEQVSGAENPLEEIRAAWARSRERLGGLFYATELAERRGLDVSLQVKSGDAAARWRDRFHSEPTAEFSPGWTTGVIIHR